MVLLINVLNVVVKWVERTPDNYVEKHFVMDHNYLIFLKSKHCVWIIKIIFI